MLFEIKFRKRPSISIAFTTIIFMQHVGSNVNLLELPQDQKRQLLPLPDESDDWVTIRNPNHSLLYVDKTEYLWNLVTNYSSRRKLIVRPGRFGKTTFLQMAQQYFKGNKKLFKGLYIETRGNRRIFPSAFLFETDDGKLWREYPVIYMNFRKIENFENIQEFESHYYKMISSIARTYELRNFEPGYGSTMLLIEQLYFKFNKTPVIILADEYDFPYECALYKNNQSLAQYILEFYDGIFGIVKNSVEMVGYLLIIGISKLALELIGSGANNIIDETYNPDYSQAFGFTKDEIAQYMGPYLEEFAQSMSLAPKDFMEKFAYNYDGYQYDLNNQRQRVFNPISTILSLKNKQFKSYWCDTESMENVTQMFYEEGWSLDNLLRGDDISDTTMRRGLSEPILPNLVTWMFYHGYYTIARKEGSFIRLKIPNHEVETAINATLLSYDPIVKMPFSLSCKNDLICFMNQLNLGFVQQALITLTKIGLPAYARPLDQEILPYEVTSRLDMIFKLAGIEHENGIVFKKRIGEKDEEGDIDIWTTNLKTNYAIKVETPTGNSSQFLPIQGMNQLLGYAQNCRDSMLNKLGNPHKMYLLSLAFKLNRGHANLTGWIVLPATNGIPEINKFKASSTRLMKEFDRRIKKSQTKFEDPI